jgi:hypothetical protein
MKKIVFYSSFLLFSVFINAQVPSEKAINTLLNNWHNSAATSNFNAYFDALTDDSIFIGTDATEHWDKKAFIVFAKPYFDKGKAWNFTSLDRHIYFSADKKIAWFDELLKTQMKICRGSGVLVFEKNQWKIKQYVLSMTIPNDTTDEVIKIKAPIEDALISKLQK